MSRFEGVVRGYIFKLGAEGLVYYRNETTRTRIGRVGREVAEEAAAASANENDGGGGDSSDDDDWLIDSSDDEEEAAANARGGAGASGGGGVERDASGLDEDPDAEGIDDAVGDSDSNGNAVIELPLVEAAALASAAALSDLADFDLESYSLSDFAASATRPGWCAYALVGQGPSVTLGLEEATSTDSVGCPALAHARLATLPMVPLDTAAVKRLKEQRILRARAAFSLESELEALRWLRKIAYDAAKQLGRFIPAQPDGGDGSGKMRLAWKSCLQSTGREVGGVEVDTIEYGFKLSHDPTTARTQRTLLHLCGKLDQATLRATCDSSSDRTACCAVPLPRGFTDPKGVPLHKGDVMLIGGPGRAGPVEAIDLSKPDTPSFCHLPAMPGASAGCASAAAVVAPVRSAKGGKLRPVVLVIGGLCGTTLLRSVRCFDPSAPVGESWESVRVPPLPPGMGGARSGMGVAVVVPRRWMLPARHDEMM